MYKCLPFGQRKTFYALYKGKIMWKTINGFDYINMKTSIFQRDKQNVYQNTGKIFATNMTLLIILNYKQEMK